MSYNVIDGQLVADNVRDDDVVLGVFDGVQFCCDSFDRFVHYAVNIIFPALAVCFCSLGALRVQFPLM